MSQELPRGILRTHQGRVGPLVLLAALGAANDGAGLAYPRLKLTAVPEGAELVHVTYDGLAADEHDGKRVCAGEAHEERGEDVRV